MSPAARGQALRLAARLARREVRRRPGRTLLVALLVALPVGGTVAASVLVRTDHQTPAEAWQAAWGGADAVIREWPSPQVAAAQVPEIPSGSRTVAYRTGHRLLRTADGERARPQVSELPLDDRITDGMVRVTAGRAPARPDEVLLTRTTARELRVGVGDRLRLERPLRATWVVTGVGELRSHRGAEVAVLGAGTAFPWGGGTMDGPSTITLVDLPAAIGPADVGRLMSAGAQVSPALRERFEPGVPEDRAVDRKVRWTWVLGAVVLTVSGIVIASAFAAGARRQLTALGQLAANGAPPSVLRRVLFLQGTWTGIAGAVLGLGVAAIALVALEPHIDGLLDRDVDPYTVRLVDVVPALVLGVVAATVAASVPARTTSRIPVLAALTGRRPLGRVPRWLTAGGAVTAASGLALLALAVLGAQGADNADLDVWALIAVAGGVAVLLGACAVAPAYVSVLEPVAARLRGPWRLAARSLARQRARTGGVVSAIAATAALAVTASALVLGADRADADEVPWVAPDEVHLRAWQPHDGDPAGGPTGTAPPASLVAAVRAVVPGASVYPLTLTRSSTTNLEWRFRQPGSAAPPGGPAGPLYAGGIADAVVADERAAIAYRLSRAERRVLARVGALVFGAPAGAAELVPRTTFAPGDTGAPGPGATATQSGTAVAATVVDPGKRSLGGLPAVLLTPATAARLGLSPAPGPVVVRARAPLTDEQRDRLEEVTDDARDEHAEQVGEAAGGIDVQWYSPGWQLDPLLVEALLAGVALAFCLFVIAASLALAAAETREERDVLAVVGAPPAVLRATSGRKALVLTALGAALAVPVGFLPVVVFTATESGDTPLVFPWRVVALLVVAVPLVAAAVTAAATGVLTRLRPVRISTVAFD